MNHHSIADINSDMRCTTRVVSSLKENQISRFCFATRDNVANSHKTVCCQSANTPTITTVIDDIAYKSRTVETGGRGAAAPHIRITEIFFRFTNHIRKSWIRKSFARNVIIGIYATWDCINIIFKEICSVALCLEQNGISFHLIIRQTRVPDNHC